jgi:hypothetical protein
MKTARLTLLALLLTASASAQMFRGDAAHTANYPLDSPAHEGRNLVGLQWRFATEGDGISSPVVVGDRVVRVPGDDPVKLYFAAEYRPAK